MSAVLGNPPLAPDPCLGRPDWQTDGSSTDTGPAGWKGPPTRDGGGGGEVTARGRDRLYAAGLPPCDFPLGRPSWRSFFRVRWARAGNSAAAGFDQADHLLVENNNVVIRGLGQREDGLTREAERHFIAARKLAACPSTAPRAPRTTHPAVSSRMPMSWRSVRQLLPLSLMGVTPAKDDGGRR